MESEELKARLVKAKALMDTEEKWYRGVVTPTNTMCLMLAASDARVPVEVLVDQLPKEFRNYDGESGPRLSSAFQLVKYNDDENTTHADVMVVFDRAIAKADRYN